MDHLSPAKHPPAEHHLTYEDWVLTETHFVPQQLNYKETVFTIGNGYLSTRGSVEEGYPGFNAVTLINGVYDEIPIFYTELANCPNWLPVAIWVDGERFRLDRGRFTQYKRQLNLRSGLLRRQLRWQSPKGKTLDLVFERFASQADQHVLALRCQITPVDFEGRFRVQAGIDGTPENEGFNHWIILDQGYNAPAVATDSHSVWLQVRTRKSCIELGMAAALTVTGTDANIANASVAEAPTLAATFKAGPGQTVTLDKRVTVLTSRETEKPLTAAQRKLSQLTDYDQLLQEQQQAWAALWNTSDIEIQGDVRSQLVTRYNLFQLLIAAPRYDNSVSIPAKTLSGFGYRGHVFWDTEFFLLPFFIHTQPSIARNLLTYRYHTLPGARRKASHYGYRGAMYAWESADTGDDVTPRWGMPNDPYAEDIRIWVRDREVHISSVIPRGIWWYWYSTQDHIWMRDYGAEIILDTALFWSSRVEYDVQREHWVILDVIGPDEYHEENVDNNAFTNRLVQWHLYTALEVYDWLGKNFPAKAAQLTEQLQLTARRIARWKDIAENMWIPIDSRTGLIEQFDGFFQLEDINLLEYEPRNRSMQAILGIQGANQRQVLKQPDVLMLLYVMGIFSDTDYGSEILKTNWDYYGPRTDVTYGSSLGPAIQGLVAAGVGDVEKAYEYFELAALVDLENNRGNTAEGIHAASCGNIWQAIVFGVAGIKFTENGPQATPHLPPLWTRLKFKVHWRGEWCSFDIQADMEQKTIRAAIFDLDGVITDTAEFHYKAWQQMADEEGLPFDREKNDAIRGLSRRASLMAIVGVGEASAEKTRNYSETQITEMMERKNRYYKSSIKDINADNLLPGVKTLLHELKEAGIKLAIGSGSKNAKTVLDQLGIADEFEVIADGYSVERSKPFPDLFLHAASQLGVKPEQCVVFEDAAAGVEAALAGKMYAVGIGEEDRLSAANVVLPGLDNVHWSDLQRKLTD